MPAAKRDQTKESAGSPQLMPWPSDTAARFVAGMQQAAVGIAVAAEECRHAARLARERGHPIEAAALERYATLISAWEDEGWARNLELAKELACWLPFVDELKGASPMEREAWRTTFTMRLEIAPETKKQMIRQITEQRGRAESTRRLAIHAMELRREGKPWDEVAKSLPCDWTNVDNPGNSMRRQVDFLKRALKKCGVRFEGS